jgi:hypothetical protein
MMDVCVCATRWWLKCGVILKTLFSALSFTGTAASVRLLQCWQAGYSLRCQQQRCHELFESCQRNPSKKQFDEDPAGRKNHGIVDLRLQIADFLTNLVTTFAASGMLNCKNQNS